MRISLPRKAELDSSQYALLSASAETYPFTELLTQSAKGPLKNMAHFVGQNTSRYSQLEMIAHYVLVLLHIIP